MYLTAKDAGVDRSAWFGELSYKIGLEGGERLQAIEPVVSYGTLTVDVANDINLSGTWDRTKLAVGVLFHLVDKTKIKLEYYVNGEETGGAEKDNDELMVQLEIKF